MTTIRKFRPDIEVLRAIAVIAVIIAHSKLALPSGFIGVDIFFVISGFLITKHLHDEVAKTGTVSLKSFYARRILRIFPASMLVLLLTLLGSFIFLSPLQLINYCWDAFFSAISGLNYRLAVTGTDYFQSTTIPTPFQHFWSLALEEQFYLIWPLLILLIAKIFVRKPKTFIESSELCANKLTNVNFIKTSTGKLSSDILVPISKNIKVKANELNSDLLKLEVQEQFEYQNFDKFKISVSVLLISIIIVSLYLSYKITGESQPWAYFGLHTRAWQLAIGALISFNLPLLAKLTTKSASILSWLGFAGLITGFVIITETTVYPGLWALLPTLSTALIVVAGTNFSKYSFEWLFDCKISRWVGKLSYSLYLIHWPIFIFIFYQLGENIKVTDRIAAILISIILSVLSWAVVENPVRFNRELKSSFELTYKIGFALILLVSISSFGVGYAKQKISNNQKIIANATGTSETEVFNKLQQALNLNELPIKLAKPLEQVSKETGSSCISIETIATPVDGPKCKLGEINSEKTIVLLGDSHANQWTNVFDQIAKRNNYKLVTFTKAGCSMTDIKHFNPLLKRDYTECYSYRAATLEEIAKIKPDIVVTTELIYQNSTSQTYSAFIQKLKSMSNQVVRLSDTPRPAQNIPECLTKNNKDIQKCSFNLEITNNVTEKEKANLIAENLDIKVIDVTNLFCLNKVCPAIADNIAVYNDDSHISETYAKYLAEIINNKIFSIANKIIDATKLNKLPDSLQLSLDKIYEDNPKFDCIFDQTETEIKSLDRCFKKYLNSNKTIALIGDSHAYQWADSIAKIAQTSDYNLLILTKPGCPLSNISVFDPTLKRDYTECYVWRKNLIIKLKEIKPDIIITSTIIYEQSTTDKYIEFMKELQAITKNVIKIVDSRKPAQNIPECIAKNSKDIQRCSFGTDIEIINGGIQKDLETKASLEIGINIVETSDWFCLNKTCPPIIDNVVVYQDDNHVSNSYVNYLTPYLQEKLQPLLK